MQVLQVAAALGLPDAWQKYKCEYVFGEGATNRECPTLPGVKVGMATSMGNASEYHGNLEKVSDYVDGGNP